MRLSYSRCVKNGDTDNMQIEHFLFRFINSYRSSSSFRENMNDGLCLTNWYKSGGIRTFQACLAEYLDEWKLKRKISFAQ